MATRVNRRDRDDEDDVRGRGRDDDRDRDRDRDDEPPRSSRSSRRSERDDEDDRPRRSSRDDDDDRPRRSSRDEDDDRPRRSSRDDDDRPRRGRDDEDDDHPRRSSRDDDDRPRRGSRDDDDRPRRSSRDDDDDAPRSRRGRDDDDDDRPRSRSRSRDDDDDGVGSGWSGSHKQREKARTTDRFDLPEPADGTALLKCLQDVPFCSAGVHWVETREGRKPFNCPDDPTKDDDSCPVCAAGHAPSAQDFFNVAVFDGKKWKNKYIKAGIGLATKIETANQARSGPLTKVYFEVAQKGGRGRKDGAPQYTWNVVRDREVDKEWKTDPLTDDEFDELYEKRYRKSDVFRPASDDDLRAAAREVRDRD